LIGQNDLEGGGACRKQADVLFLIDTTSNMDYDYFQTYMLGFVIDVVQKLSVDDGRTRVAVGSFSDSAQVRHSISRYNCFYARQVLLEHRDFLIID